MHVLVVGLRGVGAEIGTLRADTDGPPPCADWGVDWSAKCLALSGIQRLTLLDDDLVREEDLATNVE
jgi:tRNA A37 threonylcarbamoyladenosine dehydratase